MFRLTKFVTPYSGDLRNLKKSLFGFFKEIKMSKKLIVGLALAVVLFSGSLISAQADSRYAEPVRDRDCAGNLITPDVMASPGF